MQAVIRLAAILCLLASSVAAQNWPHGMPSDEFTLDREADHYATLSFYNADPPNSGHYPQTLTAGDLTVRLRLDFSQGPEVLTVIPPEGWRAEPETISVIDGEIGVIELFRGGLGM